ncbi:MAG: hypothetical protein AAFR77_05170 [Cyanobacteria bacterium J06631_2]
MSLIAFLSVGAGLNPRSTLARRRDGVATARADADKYWRVSRREECPPSIKKEGVGAGEYLLVSGSETSLPLRARGQRP